MEKGLFKERKHKEITLEGKVYKLPVELTVEEVERLLEYEVELEKLENEKVSSNEKDKIKQLQKFYKLVFSRLEVWFQHFQPEITAFDLKRMLTHNEALDLLNWRNEFKYKDQVKKKSN